jgi:superfamily I DNA/RNA helicase
MNKKTYQVAVTEDFSRARQDLNASGRRHQQDKVDAAMLRWNLDGEVKLTPTRHGESRAKVDKYDLGGGYRLITKRAAETMMFLFVGTHDKADRWLDRHRNYEFVADAKNRVSFVPSTINMEMANKSREVIDFSPDVVERRLLNGLSDELWEQLGTTAKQREVLQGITNTDYETRHSDDKLLGLGLTDELQLCLIDILAAAYRSEHNSIAKLIGRLKGQAHTVDGSALQRALVTHPVSEEIVTMSDPEEIQDYLNHDQWEAWQLFLHADQHALVKREYNGPARVRGISGSGKTCIVVHRAVHLARLYKQPVRLVAATHSLTQVLRRLTDKLCGKKKALSRSIHVMTIQETVIEAIKEYDEKWYKEHSANDGALRLYDPLTSSKTSPVVRFGLLERLKLERSVNDKRLRDDEIIEFGEDELRYVRTTYTRSERQSYMTARRLGRSLALSQACRASVLESINKFEQELEQARMIDDDGLVLQALSMLERKLDWRPIVKDNDFDPHFPRCILADESQDFSENILRFLGRVSPPIHDGLFLVGDGAQKIFKTGFTFSSAGIDVKGRSAVLRKNYRNTRQILAAAFPLVQAYVNEEAEENISYLEGNPELSSRDGVRPSIIGFPTSEAECRGIVERIAISLRIGARQPSEILVIPIPPMEDLISRSLEVAGIKHTTLSKNPVPMENPDRIRLGTIEHAKGLEFPVVYIMGLVDGGLPREGARVRGELWQAAAQLFVAMTRARDELFLTYHQQHDGDERRPSMLLETVMPFCDKHHAKASDEQSAHSGAEQVAPKLHQHGDPHVRSMFTDSGMGEAYRRTQGDYWY